MEIAPGDMRFYSCHWWLKLCELENERRSEQDESYRIRIISQINFENSSMLGFWMRKYFFSLSRFPSGGVDSAKWRTGWMFYFSILSFSEGESATDIPSTDPLSRVTKGRCSDFLSHFSIILWLLASRRSKGIYFLTLSHYEILSENLPLEAMLGIRNLDFP